MTLLKINTFFNKKVSEFLCIKESERGEDKTTPVQISLTEGRGRGRGGEMEGRRKEGEGEGEGGGGEGGRGEGERTICVLTFLNTLITKQIYHTLVVPHFKLRKAVSEAT